MPFERSAASHGRIPWVATASRTGRCKSGWDVTASWLGGAARFRHPLQARCAAEKGTTSLPRNSRLANFPDLARARAWRTNLAVSRPITAMPIAGGPLRSGTHDRTLEHRRRWEPSTPCEPVRSGVQTQLHVRAGGGPFHLLLDSTGWSLAKTSGAPGGTAGHARSGATAPGGGRWHERGRRPRA